MTYFGGWHSPDLEVVWPHKQIGDTNAHGSKNVLVKGPGFRAGYTRLQRSVDHTAHTGHLFFLGQHGDVVLEGIGDP